MKLYCPVLAVLAAMAIAALTGAAVCYDKDESCKAAGDKYLSAPAN